MNLKQENAHVMKLMFIKEKKGEPFLINHIKGEQAAVD